ncbi:hypothetical protein [Spirillospora sp. CA-294931]|uniref:hypothetical protein n=1 Tax=Spirillospora sp. CA-294931 TaxID=3240042 RepID=UPI003D9081EA
MIVVVVLALAAVAVLGAVVALAMGRGGELTEIQPEYPPIMQPEGRPVTGAEVAMLRLPRSLWGYRADVTDEALHRLAYALSERDARMAALEHQCAELKRRLAEHEGGWTDEESPGWTNEEHGRWTAEFGAEPAANEPWTPPADNGGAVDLIKHQEAEETAL